MSAAELVRPADTGAYASLDLVYINGTEIVSRAIRAVQRPGWNRLPHSIRRRSRRGGYSHVAMVVRNDVLDAVPPGEAWVLESTMSGRWGDGVRDVDGHGRFGVQLRRLPDLLEAYTGRLAAKGAAIGHARWRGPPPTPADRAVLSALWRNKLRGTRYNMSPLVLLASVCPQLRPARRLHALLVPQDRFLFCSELVAWVLQWLGRVAPDVVVDEVVPMDFVGWGEEGAAWLPYGPIVRLMVQ